MPIYSCLTGANLKKSSWCSRGGGRGRKKILDFPLFLIAIFVPLCETSDDKLPLKWTT